MGWTNKAVIGLANVLNHPSGKIIKIISLSLALVWITFSGVRTVLACPAAPLEFPLVQPDGSVILVRQWGDEWNNGLETLDGYSIVKDEISGYWVYADIKDGELVPTNEIVGKVAENELLRRQKHLRPQPYLVPQLELENKPTIAEAKASETQRNTLILLIQFSDRQAKTTTAQLSSLVFTSSTGLKRYFSDTSYSNVEINAAKEKQGLVNDGIIEVKLAYPHPDLGSNTRDPRSSKIIKDALSVADQFVDFSEYDTNHDGAISNEELFILAVAAGYEASYNPFAKPSIWAHYSSLDWVGAPLLDGKIIGSTAYGGGYSLVGELHRGVGEGSEHLATVGVLAHELGHALGLPDLYDTSQQSYGVGKWSLMGYGAWNNVGSQFEGSSPALLDAWSKWYLGWINPQPIHGRQEVVIKQAATDAVSAFYYLAPNPNNIDWSFQQHSGLGEYFLLENRQLVGMDAGLPGCGILVWHIYENARENNLANNPPKPLVYLVQADGKYHLDTKQNFGDDGDPYRSPSVFNASSTPNSNFYNGNNSNVSISGLSSCSEAMTATLNYAQLNPIPVITTISPDQVNAGGGRFQLSVNGSNYVLSSIVRWNGKDLRTTYKSDTELLAEVEPELIQSSGIAMIQVYNPAPGGGLSASSATLTIGNGINPPPILNWVTPTQAVQGGKVFMLTANGQSFVANSTVNWNGIPLPTKYIHDGELQAEVSAELLLQAGLVNITVSNPQPGGGISIGRTFIVTSPPKTYRISGRITDENGVPLEGVYVSYGVGSGTASQANGVFELEDLIAGSYTLKPSKAGFTFEPAQRPVSIIDRHVENQNFIARKDKAASNDLEEKNNGEDSGSCLEGQSVCNPITFDDIDEEKEEKSEVALVNNINSSNAITGEVRDAENKPLPGVVISTKQGYSTISGTDGKYRLDNLPSGSYDIKAELKGYRFTQNFVNPVQVYRGEVINKDFKGFAAVKGNLTITGSVYEPNGTPVSGVIIEDLEGLYRTTTDAQGQYVLSELSAGAYVLRAVKDGQLFTPSLRTILLRDNLANVNFTLLSNTIIVNSTSDEEDVQIGDGICASTSGVCTLRAALQEANSSYQATQIILESAVYSIELDMPLYISSPMMIQGKGRDQTIIMNKRNAVLFEINHQHNNPIGVTFSQLSLTKSVGAAITSESSPAWITLDDVAITESSGSGILADYSDVTVYRSEIVNNHAVEKSGALEVIGHAGYGMIGIINSLISGNEGSTGGIYTDRGIVVINSTIAANMGKTKAGGLMLDGGEGIIINSTIGENIGLEGAGVWVNAPLQIHNATIAKNQAIGSGNGDFNSGFGGGIYIYPGGNKVKIQNTILSENSSPTGAPNCFGTIVSLGYNLLGDITGCQFQAMEGDIVGYDPGINGLMDNGGETPTFALQVSSWAVDAGNPSGCTDEKGLMITTDQRGYARPVDGKKSGKVLCDIGAFEFQTVEAPFQISGRIADQKGIPLEGVLVTLDNGRSVLTDKNGYYSITEMLAGNYKLSAAKAGYLFSPPARTVKVPPSSSKINFVGLKQ